MSCEKETGVREHRAGKQPAQHLLKRQLKLSLL